MPLRPPVLAWLMAGNTGTFGSAKASTQTLWLGADQLPGRSDATDGFRRRRAGCHAEAQQQGPYQVRFCPRLKAGRRSSRIVLSLAIRSPGSSRLRWLRRADCRATIIAHPAAIVVLRGLFTYKRWLRKGAGGDEARGVLGARCSDLHKRLATKRCARQPLPSGLPAWRVCVVAYLRRNDYGEDARQSERGSGACRNRAESA